MNYISKELSSKVLTLGVSKKTKGGMTSVLISYDKYFENMQFIPTWKLSNKFIKLVYAIQAYLRLWFSLTFNKRIKIIHIHGAANASFFRCAHFIKLAHKKNRKIILHEHAADFIEFYSNSNQKEYILEILSLCDRLIVLSESWKKYYKGIGVNENKIIVLNNIVPPPVIKKNKEKDSKLHLLYLGEISYRKGGFDLLDAIKNNKNLFGGRLLLRIGGNEVDGDIRKYIKENDLENIISFEGWVSGEKKIECLNWADVYILPSYNEGLPIAILEAMSYSCPVISTPVGGIPEIIKNNQNGILVNPGNQNEISNAVSFFINHPENIRSYGSVSFEIVQDFFPEKVFTKLKSVYLEILP